MSDAPIIPNEQVTPQLAREAARHTGPIHVEHPDPADDWKLSTRVEGAGYDTCPNDCCRKRNVEAKDYVPGRYYEYQCGYDPATNQIVDGCGTAWFRETPQGHAYNVAHGLERYSTARQTTDALVGRVYSIPSDAYRRNWSRIDWSK